MAADAQAAAMLGAAVGLQSLDDEMVKLVGYNVVCLEYGDERILDEGSGTVMITERMGPNDFVAFIISDYLNTRSQDLATLRAAEKPDEEAIQALEADLEKLRQAEPGSLDVHFVVMRRWPRRNPKFAEKRVKALAGVGKAWRKPRQRPGRAAGKERA